MLDLCCRWENGQENKCIVSEWKLTSHAEFAMLVAVGKLPDPSIVVSMSTICPSMQGDPAVADACPQRSLTQSHDVIFQ